MLIEMARLSTHVTPCTYEHASPVAARFTLRVGLLGIVALCTAHVEELCFDASIALRESEGRCPGCGSDGEPLPLTCPVCSRKPTPGFRD